jgi:hypothetical protein
VSCHGRAKASLSQGDTVAAIHAIRAQVGDAVRPIQPAASPARHASAFRFFAAASVVIFSLPGDVGRFRSLKTRAST